MSEPASLGLCSSSSQLTQRTGVTVQQLVEQIVEFVKLTQAANSTELETWTKEHVQRALQWADYTQHMAELVQDPTDEKDIDLGIENSTPIQKTCHINCTARELQHLKLAALRRQNGTGGARIILLRAILSNHTAPLSIQRFILTHILHRKQTDSPTEFEDTIQSVKDMLVPNLHLATQLRLLQSTILKHGQNNSRLDIDQWPAVWSRAAQAAANATAATEITTTPRALALALAKQATTSSQAEIRSFFEQDLFTEARSNNIEGMLEAMCWLAVGNSTSGPCFPHHTSPLQRYALASVVRVASMSEHTKSLWVVPAELLARVCAADALLGEEPDQPRSLLTKYSAYLWSVTYALLPGGGAQPPDYAHVSKRFRYLGGCPDLEACVDVWRDICHRWCVLRSVSVDLRPHVEEELALGLAACTDEQLGVLNALQRHVVESPFQ